MLCSVVVAIADRHAPIVFSNSGCKDSLKSNERGPQCLGEGGEQTCKQTGTPRWALLHTGRPGDGQPSVQRGLRKRRPQTGGDPGERGRRARLLCTLWRKQNQGRHEERGAQNTSGFADGRRKGRECGDSSWREPQASDDGEPFTPSGPRGTHETVPECEGPPGGRQGAGRARGQSECPAELTEMRSQVPSPSPGRQGARRGAGGKVT